MNSANDYLNRSQAILERIQSTQMEAIQSAAELCTQAIAGDGLVHLFGTGHSRIFVEEMFPLCYGLLFCAPSSGGYNAST